MSYAVQGRDHRARPRRRRFRAGRLRRRRPAARRRRSRARSASARCIDPACARALLRLRHAVLRPALRFRPHRASRSSTTRRSTRSKRSIANMEAAGPRRHRRRGQVKPRADRRRARRRHALCRPGARGDGRPADRACSKRRTATAIKQQFDDVHQVRYGTSAPQEPAEIVSLRATVIGVMREAAAGSRSRRQRAAATPRPLRGTRPVYFRRGGFVADARPISARALLAGNRIAGPALIEEHASTTVLQPGDSCAVDALRQSASSTIGSELTMSHRKPASARPAAHRSGHRPRSSATACIAVTEEMKTNLMRTAYNMIIYEALDFTVGLFDARRRHGVDRPRPADVHPRHDRDGEGEDQALRHGRTSSRATSCSPTTPTSPAATSTT